MTDLPDLESLRVLTAVAATGSLTAASARLGISQQAVSLRIRGLEMSIGVPLIIRSSRGSDLTATGELVVGWAAAVLAAADGFTTSVAALHQDRRREFRIAASLTIAEHLVPHWLAHPHNGSGTAVHLTAVNSTAVIDLVRHGDVDLGFIETPDIPGDLRSVTFAHDELVVVASARHPWARRKHITAEELAATPLVVREQGSGTRYTFERTLAAATGLSPVPPAAVLPSGLGIRTTTAAGFAPAVLSALAVRDDIRLGRLTRIHVDNLNVTRPLTAVWLHEPTADATELLRKIAEELTDQDR